MRLEITKRFNSSNKSWMMRTFIITHREENDSRYQLFQLWLHGHRQLPDLYEYIEDSDTGIYESMDDMFEEFYSHVNRLYKDYK